jgi:hypothetical protein
MNQWIYEVMLVDENAKKGMVSTASDATQLTNVYMTIAPRRLLRDNQLRYNQYIDEFLARVSVDGQQYDPDLPSPLVSDPLGRGFDSSYFALCTFTLSAYEDIERSQVQLQTLLDETRVAIALERFRLAHEELPATLTALVPAYLPAVPIDIYTKKPLIYRRLGNATFQLYSVGKNRTDDGGKIDPKLGERAQLDDVWFYAPNGGDAPK